VFLYPKAGFPSTAARVHLALVGFMEVQTRVRWEVYVHKWLRTAAMNLNVLCDPTLKTFLVNKDVRNLTNIGVSSLGTYQWNRLSLSRVLRIF
jgi:hypothetical protein